MSLSQFFESRNSSQNPAFLNLFQAKSKPPQPSVKKEKIKQAIQEEKPEIQEVKKIEEKKVEEVENLESTIFVGNVPLTSNHKEIKKFFSNFGLVEKVWFRSIPTQVGKLPKKAAHILKKYQDGANSMNAYVRFDNIDSAKNACQMNGQKIGDHNIRITMCNEFETDYETSIFIGNLPLNVKDQQLWDAFSRIGNIESVRVIRKKGSMEGIGVGYVKFSSSEQMRKAIKEMNGEKIGDREMRIKKAIKKDRLQKKYKKIATKKGKVGMAAKGPLKKRKNNFQGKKTKFIKKK